MSDVKDFTLQILSKISRVEEAVVTIQEGTMKAQEMVNRVDEKMEHNHTIVSNNLELNADLVNELVGSRTEENSTE